MSWFGAGVPYNKAGVSILISYEEKPPAVVKLPIFSEFMENSTKFIKKTHVFEVPQTQPRTYRRPNSQLTTKLKPIKWNGDQSVIAKMLEYVFFGPSL